MIKRLVIVLVSLFAATGVFAQKQERPLVQFSGITENADSLKATGILPYVTITDAATQKAVYITNYKGYFSFVAHELDTLRFTAVGFAPVEVIIPANILTKSYTVQVRMKPQAINLPAFHVFPWATVDEFRKDFLTMKVADDDLENARKNLSRAAMAATGNSLPRDANEIQSSVARDMHTSIMNSHSLIPNPLLNPIAWGTLIKQIADGDKSRTSN